MKHLPDPSSTEDVRDVLDDASADVARLRAEVLRLRATVNAARERASKYREQALLAKADTVRVQERLVRAQEKLASMHAREADARRADADVSRVKKLVRNLPPQIRGTDRAPITALLFDPFNLGLAQEWCDALEESGVVDVPAHLLEALTVLGEPIPAVLEVILKARAAVEAMPADASLAALVEQFLESRDARLVADAWAAMRSLESLPLELATNVARVSPLVVRCYFYAAPPRWADAVSSQLDESVARWWRDDFTRAEPPVGEEPQFSRGLSGREAKARHNFAGRALGFKLRALRDRAMRLRDPSTGRFVEPFDASAAATVWQYSFGHRNLSVLMTEGGSFAPTAVYSGATDEIVSLGLPFPQPTYRLGKACAALAAILIRAVRAPAEWNAAIAGRDVAADGGRRMIVIATQAENPMHHLWNLFPGLEEVVAQGLAPRVDEVWSTPTLFYGAISQLYPEFDRAEHHVVDRQHAGDPYPYSATHLPIRVGGYFIRESQVNRLTTFMQELPGDALVADPDPHDTSPVVWFGLRVASRAWRDQAGGIPSIIDAIHARYGDARVVLDGYTRAVGEDAASENWRDEIASLKFLAAEIKSRVALPDLVVDLTGASMREATLWARVTDVYLTPMGSSQHKVGWFSDGVGIQYGPAAVAAQLKADKVPPHGTFVSEGRYSGEFFAGRSVDPGRRRRAGDARPGLDIVSLDAVRLQARLLKLLDERVKDGTPHGIDC